MHCFAVEETLSSGFVLDVHVIVCLAWLKKTSRDVENRDQRHVEDLQAWFDIKDPKKTSLTQKMESFLTWYTQEDNLMKFQACSINFAKIQPVKMGLEEIEKL